jgi:transcriptional regulator with XRE-family HTH domain
MVAHDIQLARQAIGAHMRQIREATGLNGKEFAARLGWSTSKLSKIETGKQTPTRADIAGWTSAAGRPEAAQVLADELAEVQQWYTDYRGRVRSGMRFRQQEAAAVERTMTRLRTFSAARVPAFFQTPEYARHMLTGFARLYDAPDDVGEAVAVRMQRQEVLYRPAKRFHILITEGVLRSCAVAPAPVMMAQLDRLVAATTIPAVEFGVIPFSRQWPLFLDHGFWIYDDDLVIIETLAAELRLSRPDEIELYARAFGQLADLGCYGADARALLTGALVDLAEQSREIPNDS